MKVRILPELLQGAACGIDQLVRAAVHAEPAVYAIVTVLACVDGDTGRSVLHSLRGQAARVALQVTEHGSGLAAHLQRLVALGIERKLLLKRIPAGG